MRALSARLGRADLIQFALGFFALLLFTVAVTWPSSSERANESWFSLVQVKGAALVLLAVGFGSVNAKESPPERLFTLLALLVLHLLALPFELATYASSFPGTPLWWPLVTQPLDTAAYFGVGLFFGHLLRRLDALLPLLPPLVIIGAISFDVWLGVALLNPVATATVVSWGHLGFALALACLTLLHLGRALRHNEEDDRVQSAAD